jgi:hypothetical protein
MTLQNVADLIVPFAIILGILAPIWLFWFTWRVERHLFHVSVALWQIRDALRAQPADKPIEGVPHIVNSMFGR